MPGYAREGVVEVGFAGLSLGKGMIGYRRPAGVDLEVARALLADTRTSESPVC